MYKYFIISKFGGIPIGIKEFRMAVTVEAIKD